jgi:hypothetical protein
LANYFRQGAIQVFRWNYGNYQFKAIFRRFFGSGHEIFLGDLTDISRQATKPLKTGSPIFKCNPPGALLPQFL